MKLTYKRKAPRFDGLCPRCEKLPKLDEKSYCRPCVNIRNTEYRRKYPERIKASQMRYRECIKEYEAK